MVLSFWMSLTCRPDWGKKAADNDLKDATHTTAQKTNRGVLQTAMGDYVNKEKWLMFRPYLEVFHTGKVLVPHMEMKIQFHFNDPNFWTTLPTRAFGCCPRTSKSDSFCQLRLNSNLYKTLTIERQREPYAKYPVVRGEIRTYTFQGNTDSWEENNIFQGRIPHRMIVGLFDAKAFNQDRDCYPFVFQKFGLETIKEIVRGEE